MGDSNINVNSKQQPVKKENNNHSSAELKLQIGNEVDNKQAFKRCEPSSSTGAGKVISSTTTSSTEEEEIDYGQLSHRLNLPDDGCSSPGEKCVSITNPAITKIADDLTQEDASYIDGLCIPDTYFEDQQGTGVGIYEDELNNRGPHQENNQV